MRLKYNAIDQPAFIFSLHFTNPFPIPLSWQQDLVQSKSQKKAKLKEEEEKIRRGHVFAKG